MGFFKNCFKSEKNKDEEKDFSFILEIAKLISNNDEKIIQKITQCVDDPWGYGKENAERYMERGIDVSGEKTTNVDKICWIGLVDELAEAEYLLVADWKDDPEQFLWVLESIKGYDEHIDIDISSLEFDPDENIDVWGGEINSALNGKAYVCMIDINSDGYELIIVTCDIYEKISEIAENNGHLIKAF